MLSQVRQMSSVSDREALLRSFVSDITEPKEIISYRDFERGTDVFLVEFFSSFEASEAEANLGMKLIHSTVASLTLPLALVH
jgi:hypothetical protein